MSCIQLVSLQWPVTVVLSTATGLMGRWHSCSRGYEGVLSWPRLIPRCRLALNTAIMREPADVAVLC